MFLNVYMDERSRHFHRFLWKTATGALRVLQFNVHIFGNAGSPAVAVFVLKSAAQENARECPRAAVTINESSLMDDILDSFDSVSEAQKALQELLKVFDQAGFKAHKFVSNSKEIMQNIPEELRAKSISLELPGCEENDQLPIVKILGLIYLAERDEFAFQFAPFACQKWTKRTILKSFPRLFDPHGFLAPFILEARKIYQECVMAGLHWDTEVLPSIERKWVDWLKSARDHLSDIRVPRQTSFGESVPKMEFIHIFSDASEGGMAAVAYRVTRAEGTSEYTVRFLMAKSKVSPIRTVSMPRLELLAAELSMKILQEIRKVHKIPLNNIFLWTDATDVLAWLNNHSKRLSKFVSHRITRMQEGSLQNNWRKVPGEINPADIGSRGSSLENLAGNSLWWSGPPFLTKEEKHWPAQEKCELSETALGEFKSNHRDKIGTGEEVGLVAVAKTVEPQVTTFETSDRLHPERFSSFTRYIRIIARIRQWFHKFKGPSEGGRSLSRLGGGGREPAPTIRAGVEQGSGPPTPKTEVKQFWVQYEKKRMSGKYCAIRTRAKEAIADLSEEELNRERVWTMKSLQRTYYAKEIEALKKGQPVPKTSALAQYTPTLDAEGLLRVGGRLLGANKLTMGARTPLIVPPAVAKIIMNDIHAQTRHGAGYSAILDRYFEDKWSIGARRAAANVVQNCAKCRNLNGRTAQQIMAPLPDFRLGALDKRESVFEVAVADVCGPFLVSRSRGRGQVKRWILAFVCTVFRAVHLELLFAMDTSSFCQALERFVARRGRVRLILCDNGTNFRAAARVLRETYEANKKDILGEPLPEIEWSFAPSKAPHYQGLVEAQNRAIKRTMTALVQPGRLTEESILTFLTITERLINERPISYVNSNPADIQAVRASHFLCSNFAQRLFPEGWKGHSFSKKFFMLQALLDVWWKRYLKELIPSLHARRVWRREREELRVGDVVAVLDTQADRGSYPLGRVVSLRRSRADDRARACEIRIGNKVLTRPVTQLIPLSSAAGKDC